MPQIYRNVAVWLRVGLGANSIIYAPHGGGPAQFAAWNPASPGLPEFGIQIGGPNSPAAGTLVGEAYSRDLFVEGIREGLFPLDRAYAPTDHDDDLLKLVAVNGMPAYQALVLPALKMAGITADPGPVARNAPAGLGGVVQGGGAQGALGTGPGDGGLISHPESPAPTTATTAPTVSADPSAWTDADTATLIALIERHLPGQGAQIAKLVETAGKIRAAGSTSAAFIAALPEIEAELGVTDPKVAAALGLIALFAH